jgi:hypothetical protein
LSPFGILISNLELEWTHGKYKHFNARAENIDDISFFSDLKALFHLKVSVERTYEVQLTNSNNNIKKSDRINQKCLL